MLTASEPIRVRAGDRIRFLLFNASASRPVSLQLPGHTFEVHAMDERPLLRPARAAHLEIAPGERIDARVEMNRPGRWVLGSLSRVEQRAGFGRLVEYAGTCGEPIAPVPAPVAWRYGRFAQPGDPLQPDPPPCQEVLLDRDDWDRRVLRVQPGRRQRLFFYNLLRAPQVVALRGHDLELRQAGPVHVRALYKDTLSLPSSARVAVDFEPRRARVELLRL